MLTGPGLARAQFDPTVGNPIPGGDGGGFQAPLNEDPIIHLPTGSAGSAGFYVTAEFVMLDETRALGKQTIANRGFYDSAGNITGIPGTFIGGGTVAISTKNISAGLTCTSPVASTSEQSAGGPEGGVRIFANYMQLMESVYFMRMPGPVPPGLSPGCKPGRHVPVESRL